MHADLIRRLGGASHLSKVLGVSTHNWPARGIPWRWRPAVTAYADKLGVDVPEDFQKSPREPVEVEMHSVASR